MSQHKRRDALRDAGQRPEKANKHCCKADHDECGCLALLRNQACLHGIQGLQAAQFSHIVSLPMYEVTVNLPVC